MLSKEKIEKVKKGLTEELGRTITANECGLSTNDFSESIEILEDALKYIEQLETENTKLKQIQELGLNREKQYCFNEDGHTGKCLGYSSFNNDEPCNYCKSCERLSIKEDD